MSDRIPATTLGQLNREGLSLRKHNKEDDSIFAAYIQENNILQWRGYIEGPPDTIWEGGVFRFLMSLPKDFPRTKPQFKFTSKMFHPNIRGDGSLCISILDEWHSLSIIVLLKSIQSFLNDPNPNSPVNEVASKLLKNNPRAYESKVREMVNKSLEEPINQNKNECD